MTRYEFENLSNIGEFHLSTGIVEICDPAVTDILCEDIPVSALNQTSVVVRNCPTGQYRVMFEFENSGVPSSLICLPPVISYEDVAARERCFNYVGKVMVSYSRTVCLIDSILRNDASLCMRDIEPDALYDASDILRLMDYCPYQDHVKLKLLEFLNKCSATSGFASGAELLAISAPASRRWNVFRSRDVASTHWACDAVARIGQFPAAILTGGVVAEAHAPALKVFTLRNRSGVLFAIRIKFCHDESDFWHALPE